MDVCPKCQKALNSLPWK